MGGSLPQVEISRLITFNLLGGMRAGQMGNNGILIQMGLETNIISILIILICLVISLSIHEFIHAFVGYKLGDDTAHAAGRISLNPVRHIDPFTTILLPMITLIAFGVPLLAAKPVPFNPARVKYDEFGAAMIAVAGPLSNLALAVVGAVVYQLFGGNYFFDVFTALNVGLFVFNMIPIPPLDGSRLLYAFAPESLQDFMASLEQIGIFIVFGLVLAVPAFTDIIININQTILNALL